MVHGWCITAIISSTLARVVDIAEPSELTERLSIEEASDESDFFDLEDACHIREVGMGGCHIREAGKGGCHGRQVNVRSKTPFLSTDE